jgi:hypothetical protein
MQVFCEIIRPPLFRWLIRGESRGKNAGEVIKYGAIYEKITAESKWPSERDNIYLHGLAHPWISFVGGRYF